MTKTRSYVLFAFLLSILLTAAVGGQAVYATAPAGGDLVVTRNDDPAPNGCLPGDCSLREAIIDANADGTYTRIVITNTDTITLSIAGQNEDAAATGDLDILSIIELQGNSVVINANGIDRVFDVTLVPQREGLQGEGSTFSLYDATLTGGNVNINADPTGSNVVGAGIRVQATRSAYLQNVAIVGNTGTGGTFGFGGGVGIENGDVIFSQGSVYSNTADNAAGIAVVDGSLVLNNVTVSANNAVGAVGGIINLSNTGGVTSTLALSSVTIVDNVEGAPSGSGAGLDTTPLAGTAITTIRNSIISENVGDAQCFEGGTVTSLNYNILSDDSCNLNEANDMLNTDPVLLAPVAAQGDRGVVHYFRAPSAASPAIDSGASAQLFDQLGTSRPQDLPTYPNTTDGSDRGAIEQLAAPTAVTIGTWNVGRENGNQWLLLAGGLLLTGAVVAVAKRR